MLTKDNVEKKKKTYKVTEQLSFFVENIYFRKKI